MSSVDDAYRVVRDALDSCMDGSWTSFDNDDGIVLIGPITSDTRPVFLLKIDEARVEVVA